MIKSVTILNFHLQQKVLITPGPELCKCCMFSVNSYLGIIKWQENVGILPRCVIHKLSVELNPYDPWSGYSEELNA